MASYYSADEKLLSLSRNSILTTIRERGRTDTNGKEEQSGSSFPFK